MNLKDLVVDAKEAWMEYPDIPGFEVLVGASSKKELAALRTRCIKKKQDRKTRQIVEELDEERFVEEFTALAIKDWKGLRAGDVARLMLADVDPAIADEEVEYSQDNAVVLTTHSTEFDAWLNDAVFDLDNFR